MLPSFDDQIGNVRKHLLRVEAEMKLGRSAIIGIGFITLSLMSFGEDATVTRAAYAATDPNAAHAEFVTLWNARAVAATVASGQAATLRGRTLTIMHVSMFDAVDLIVGGYHVYAADVVVPARASAPAAATAAAHRSLRRLFAGNPNCNTGACSAATLDAALASDLSALPNDPSRADGVSSGVAVADQIVDLRATDGSTAVVPPYTGGPNAGEPGFWIPTPPAFAPGVTPQVGNMTPFALTAPDQFNIPPPPNLSDDTWVEDYNEVKTYGDHIGAARTSDQTDAALAWNVNTGGTWGSFARQLAAAQPHNLIETARIFALMQIAFTDTVIALWNAKYQFSFWRPVTAITADDGNPNTDTDYSWLPLSVTSAFPAYPSAHVGVGGASALVLEEFYGKKAPVTLTTTAFLATTDKIPNRTIVRQFDRLEDAIRDGEDARVWAGLNFRFALTRGTKVGEKVARYVLKNSLTPIDHDAGPSQ